MPRRLRNGYQSAQRALAEIEGFLERRAKQTPTPGAKPPPQDVHIAYLGVEAGFFALRECREDSILKVVNVQRARFKEIEKRLARRIGSRALMSLRDHARMQSAVIMAQPCAGERGVERLAQNLNRLAALAAKPKSG